MSEVKVNHVGLVVSNLERATRFWTGAFGFRVLGEFPAPDQSVAVLFRLPTPIGLTAVYIERGGFVIELLHYADAALVDRPSRVWNERGLTHLSLSVDDFEPYLTRVRELGGEVLEDTRASSGELSAIAVRDPDGQMVELIIGWVALG